MRAREEEPGRASAGAAVRGALRTGTGGPLSGPGAALHELQATVGNSVVVELVARAHDPGPQAVPPVAVQRAGSGVQERWVSTEEAGSGLLRKEGGLFSYTPLAGERLAGLSQKEVGEKLGRFTSMAPFASRPPEELTNATGIPGMVMEFDDSHYSFAHRSYNGTSAGPNGRVQPNDHLTVENSLAAMLAHAGRDPKYMHDFLTERMGKMKPDFNGQLGWHEYGEIDNLHFRPGVDEQRRANGTAVDVSDVDTAVSLRQFLDFVDDTAERLGLHATIRDGLRASAEQVQGRMGIAVDRMYFGVSGRRDLAKFVVLARQLTGQSVPEELQGLSKQRAELPYDGVMRTEGSPGFTDAVKELIGGESPGRYWPEIVAWATNLQPAQPVATGSPR
ncbi:hypothetical protein PV336_42920 [Streptomyces sp. MI02-2A]|uniref:hypothetical protein n=1 Tax=Streptomyces sp. NPDC057062 TaxID=3346011 RepID=UPI0011C14B5C|nr:hypothetical protein [Streptomyces sp. MI02-2A]